MAFRLHLKSRLPSQTSDEVRSFEQLEPPSQCPSIFPITTHSTAIMSLLRPHPCRLPIRPSHRPFSTTASRPVSLAIERNNPEVVADNVPEYPYGPARWYKQSNKGLYGGQRIQFGNNVSGDFNTKTRRTFQINVHTKRLWSRALKHFVQVRVTTRTLRTIDRVGGLDEYLLGDKESRIKQLGVSGWWLRWAVMQQPSIKKRLEKERYSLGLGPREEYESKLKALEAIDVSGDVEEASAALPEESKDEPAAAAEDETAEEALDSSGSQIAIPLDGSGKSKSQRLPQSAFEVTNPADFPHLTFRVDRETHVVLTPKGWIRTTRDGSEYTKKRMFDRKFHQEVETRMEKFEAELQRLRTNEMPEMSVVEEKEILQAARRQFVKELEAKVDRIFEHERLEFEEKNSPAGKKKERVRRAKARARRKAEAEAKAKEVGEGELEKKITLEVVDSAVDTRQDVRSVQ